jgi:hypothetical protein
MDAHLSVLGSIAISYADYSMRLKERRGRTIIPTSAFHGID